MTDSIESNNTPGLRKEEDVTIKCLVLAVVAFLCATLTVRASAQASLLAAGTVSGVALYNDGNNHPLGTCPSDFTSPAGNSNPPTCYSATMSCGNVSAAAPSINFVYSYVTPPSVKGTVVLFSGAGGREGSLSQVNGQYVNDYYGMGFEVVEVAWGSDWEQTVAGVSGSLGILTAACRPAGFLNYVLNTPLLNARSVSSTNGLCAQGLSAGSGAIAYSLAWYLDTANNNLSSDYDNVELESGPVFGNVKLGCEVPAPAQGIICPSGQYGCSSGTTTWSNSPLYIVTNVGSVRLWTNDDTCNDGVATSSSSNSAWQNMSIVNGNGGNFNYSNLGIGAWLCASSLASSCTPAKPCPNNSAAQGEVFYTQITSSSQVANYKLTGILLCEGTEGVSQGYDPDGGCTPGTNCPSGATAIEGHMQQQCVHSSH